MGESEPSWMGSGTYHGIRCRGAGVVCRACAEPAERRYGPPQATPVALT